MEDSAARRNRLAELAARTALRALMGELAITPKPGLVDRANSGAHRDMDFFSFIDSTAAIIPWFRDCALAGFDAAALPPRAMMALPVSDPGHPLALCHSLKAAGMEAERAMLEASGGANTHRGLIFSIGLASASFGALFRHSEAASPGELLDFAASMACNRAADSGTEADAEADAEAGGEVSHGEAIYRRYGIGGAREEARQGFPAVRDCALPALRRSLEAGHGLNAAGLAAFLHLLATVTDTNIIHRAGPEALEHIRRDTGAFLAARPSPPAMTEYATALDGVFIKQNISPGGCADLLALTLFVHWTCV